MHCVQLEVERAKKKYLARYFTAVRCDSYGDARFGKDRADAKREGMRRLARRRISRFG